MKRYEKQCSLQPWMVLLLVWMLMFLLLLSQASTLQYIVQTVRSTLQLWYIEFLPGWSGQKPCLRCMLPCQIAPKPVKQTTSSKALLSNLYTVLNPVFYTRLSKKKLVEAATFVSQKCIFPALSKDSWVLQSFSTEAIKTRKNLPKINLSESKKYGSNILSIHIKN